MRQITNLPQQNEHPPQRGRPVAAVVADFAPRRGNAPSCRPYAAHRMGLAGVVAQIVRADAAVLRHVATTVIAEMIVHSNDPICEK